MNITSATLFVLFMVSTIITYGYSALKNKHHIILCEVFRERFGFLPNGVILAQAGGIFFTFQKDFYFLLPLIVKKGSFIVRGMNSDHYDFIKTLPNEMTSWLKVKFTLFLITTILLLSNVAASYLFIKA